MLKNKCLERILCSLRFAGLLVSVISTPALLLPCSSSYLHSWCGTSSGVGAGGGRQERGERRWKREEGKAKGKGSSMNNLKVAFLNFRVSPLLLVFFIHLRIFNSTISWSLQPMLPLFILSLITSSLPVNSRSICASPLSLSSVCVEKLSLASSRNLLGSLCLAVLPFQGEHSPFVRARDF